MKKKITTTATIYVHTHEDLVVNAKEFQEEIATRAADLQNDDDRFSDWLSDTKNLLPSEIFHLTEEEKTRFLDEYETQCFEDAAEDLMDDWSEHKIEVEVEIEV